MKGNAVDTEKGEGSVEGCQVYRLLGQSPTRARQCVETFAAQFSKKSATFAMKDISNSKHSLATGFIHALSEFRIEIYVDMRC